MHRESCAPVLVQQLQTGELDHESLERISWVLCGNRKAIVYSIHDIVDNVHWEIVSLVSRHYAYEDGG